jgi:cation diffusion facilitator CzcD-associated flavoprotein CzcO
MENDISCSESMLKSPEAAAAMQVQQRYAEERNKRLRSDGVSQFIDLNTSDKFKHFQSDPWIDLNAPGPAIPALKEGSRCKHLILGAGFGGLLFAVRMIQAGIKADDIRIVDSAGGFGGTWYWNRYPGIMCDIESYIYMPLLEEMGYMPKHKYAYGPEVREYAESIAEKWGLREKTMFRMEVNSLTWDEAEKDWVVKMQHRTRQGNPTIRVRAQSVILAPGLLSCPHIPDLPDIEKYQGYCFHTSRWDYAYTGGSPTDPSLIDLQDKKVGIIGTGATAIQAVPHLAKWAKELYVFQRTPSSVDVRDNHPTDATWWTNEIQAKQGWQRERMENFNAHLSNVSPPPSVNMVADGWSKMPSFSALVGGPARVSPESIAVHVASLHALDFPRQEMIRQRIEEIVHDKNVAELLKPWYPGWCKRPCFHDDYLPTFNLPNVKLVDTDAKGVDLITEKGVMVGGSEYEIDLLIFSTGYRSPTIGSPAFKAGISVIGRDGQSLDDSWTNGVSTLHGVISHGFPNLFWPGPLQAGATGNHMFVLDQMASHVAYILSESARRAAKDPSMGPSLTIEPTVEAQEEWSMQVLSRAASFAGVAGCTPGYTNREGEMDRISGMAEQMKAARGAIWGHGMADYVSVLEGWRSQGELKGLTVTVASWFQPLHWSPFQGFDDPRHCVHAQ